jgi:hypothetical protein
MPSLIEAIHNAYGYPGNNSNINWPAQESVWENGLPNVEVWVDTYVRWSMFCLFWPGIAIYALVGLESV